MTKARPYQQRPELVMALGAIPKRFIPEIRVKLLKGDRKKFFGKISNSYHVASFIRSLFKRGELLLREQFIVLYLNRSNHIIGYYKHTTGGITGVVADVRLILGTALKTVSTGIIIAHNHPSGNLEPSAADKQMTKKVNEAADLMDISLLDHLIITEKSYYSFADEGLLGLQGKPGKEEFVQLVLEDLRSQKKHNKPSLEKIALDFGITDKNQVKEFTELAIVLRARELAHQNGTSRQQRFENILNLYNAQVNLSHRTSQSILLQQYSTPAPISYLAGVFCQIDHKHVSVFEPSAGNGLLTLAADPAQVVVNEIDPVRNSNLQQQGYKKITRLDATIPFPDYKKKFDAVLTNPPFGTLDEPVYFDSFPIRTLDHLMALQALSCMQDNGKAAIIIGGHSRWDSKHRLQAGKNRIFFNYLYSRYNVVDVIPIDGKKLYSRQGTGFDVRLILIDGRKAKPDGHAPLYDSEQDTPVRSYDALYSRIERIIRHQTQKQVQKKSSKKIVLDDLSLVSRYWSLKKKYTDRIILIGNDLYYYTFEQDAQKVSQVLSLPIENIDTGNEVIPATGFPREEFEQRLTQLQRAKLSIAVADELSAPPKHTPMTELEKEAQRLLAELENEDLGAPYQPASQSCVVLNTQVPDSMSAEIQQALARIKSEVGGDMDNFVRHRLGYRTKTDLCRALSAEQIDAVAMAIYNIEAYREGIIIGDQTGIGKGRIAASIVRYAVEQGKKPIFITEKSNLFSDIYRDLSAIGSGHLRPFIVNARESKTDVKDEDGEVIYSAPSLQEQNDIFDSGELPAHFDFVMATYSQFNSPKKKPGKPNFLSAIATDNILIMDEAHNSSGSGNTGEFLQSIVGETQGVVFLSATFAKRPDNMPIYALKTAISEAAMNREELVDAISSGGVALQEILSSQLVASGQMVRRERSFEGVEVNYITLEDLETEHRATADNITEIVRDIIAFQSKYIDKAVDELDTIAVAEGKAVELREGTSKAGVDNQPYFSKVFQVINQMLFSIKAEAVADLAIERLREGKKPVIAFASTMGSFIEDLETQSGLPVSDGAVINADFAEVLKRGLDGVLRYTEKDIDGSPTHKQFHPSELGEDAVKDYNRIFQKIQKASTGITISPIDVITDKIQKAGYSVAEVTGRKYELQINAKTFMGLVKTRKRINTNDAFRQFNNNETDALLINQSGSTGGSAHAIVTSKVPESQVKQRVMIVLQAELDINLEVQKRGRINRTGQILKPIYDYVNSAIPAEMRLMMMLQKKLKSLDANTTSNQKQSSKILDVPDFLNKYGDKVVVEYLQENQKVNDLIGDPLRLVPDENGTNTADRHKENIEDAAHRVSGRIAVLSTNMQQEFYHEITERYNDFVEYLKQIGEYDLEVETLNLQAQTNKTQTVIVGKGGRSAFGDDSILETVEANVLKKPFSKSEMENLLKDSLQGKTAQEIQDNLLEEYEKFMAQKLEFELQENEEKYNGLIKDVPNEKKLLRILEEQGEGAYREAIKLREKELESARAASNTKIETSHENRKTSLTRIFKFFLVGKKINYPVDYFDIGKQTFPAVFLGFAIDKRKKNPYAPSVVRLRFAISNSTKYVAIPASYHTDIAEIITASISMPEPEPLQKLLQDWDAQIQKRSTSRQTRYIVTGNLLQAFSQYKGKLVSYTTLEGDTRKGILMPEYWAPEAELTSMVSVPILKALPVIKALPQGAHIYSGKVSLFRQGEGYQIIVPASRSKAGDIYLDADLLKLVTNNNFEKVSDQMRATIPLENIEEAVKVLQSKFNLVVRLSQFNLSRIKGNEQTRIDLEKKPIQLPPPESEEPEMDLNLLEIEAEALLLQLDLLSL